jgi:hypothetical protein
MHRTNVYRVGIGVSKLDWVVGFYRDCVDLFCLKFTMALSIRRLA